MQYAKFAAAIVATVVSALVAAMTDGAIADAEWVNVAIAGAGAAAVFTAPNVPGAAYTKSVLAVLTAVLTFGVSVIDGGLTAAEVLQGLVIALGALGVYAAPKPEVARAPLQDYPTTD